MLHTRSLDTTEIAQEVCVVVKKWKNKKAVEVVRLRVYGNPDKSYARAYREGHQIRIVKGKPENAEGYEKAEIVTLY
jgi:hypothetical protein